MAIFEVIRYYTIRAKHLVIYVTCKTGILGHLHIIINLYCIWTHTHTYIYIYIAVWDWGYYKWYNLDNDFKNSVVVKIIQSDSMVTQSNIITWYCIQHDSDQVIKSNVKNISHCAKDPSLVSFIINSFIGIVEIEMWDIILIECHLLLWDITW